MTGVDCILLRLEYVDAMPIISITSPIPAPPRIAIPGLISEPPGTVIIAPQLRHGNFCPALSGRMEYCFPQWLQLTKKLMTRNSDEGTPTFGVESTVSFRTSASSHYE